MSETIYTFNEAAVKRIAQAVSRSENRRTSGLGTRGQGYTETGITSWLGVVEVALGEIDNAEATAEEAAAAVGTYTVKRARIVNGVLEAYPEGPAQYLSITARNLSEWADDFNADEYDTIAPVGAGEAVVIFQFFDEAKSEFVDARGFYFWRHERTNVRPAQIIGATAITDSRWVYTVTFGTYSGSTFTLGSTTALAINTIETNNTGAGVTGGDGVPLPPDVGSLSRLPVRVGAVVLCTKVSSTMFAFCVPNPFQAECE